MPSKVLVWDLPVRVFHWSLVLAFAGAYLLGESERWRDVHVALGLAALALVGFRLLWGFIGTRYARFKSFRYTPRQAWLYLSELARGRASHYTGHNPAGSWAIYGLLALGLATGVTGWLRYEEIGGEALEDVHAVFANAWLGLVVLHVAAVLVSSILHRENLPRTMVTGFKRATPDAAVPNARVAVGAAVALAAIAVVAGWLGWGSGPTPRDPGSTASAKSETSEQARKDDD
jgi:cytochrome b